MSIVLDSLYPSSFKGVPFFYISGDTTGGRKTIEHNYPNKDDRKIEDLGLDLGKFTIRGIIKGRFYTEEKLALETVLNSSESGILIHPFRGILNVVAESFTVSENINEVGIAYYTMTFSEVRENNFPIPSGNNVSTIVNEFNSIYNNVKDEFNNDYNASTNRNITSSATQILSLANALDDISKNVESNEESAKDFNSRLQIFNTNSIFIASSDDIGNQLADLIFNFDSLASESQDRLDSSRKLIGFGKNDEFLNLDTIEINERNQNKKLINGLTNGLAFANMCDSAKNIDYENEEDLDSVLLSLENAFDEIEQADYNDFMNDFFSNLITIRNQIRIFLEQTRITINKIIEIETPKLPMNVIAYKYYGNTEENQSLIQLNNITNPSFVSGTVKILES